MRAPLERISPLREICLQIRDNSSTSWDAARLFEIPNGPTSAAQATRLAEQFIFQNRSVFERIGVCVLRDFDGQRVWLHLTSGNTVGAVPLLSPKTFKPELGLIVKPRFEWAGIGPMLAAMGWLIVPTPLKLPALRRSERRLPNWVLSATVLSRLQALLEQVERRFEIATTVLPIPKGSVQWKKHASNSLSRAAVLEIPCQIADLQDDSLLFGAIRFAVERQIQSLETQRHHGSFVQRLIAVAEALHQRVRHVPSRRPQPMDVAAWSRRPLRSDIFVAGLQAIEWTTEDRGLAGMSDQEGIPWTMPMDQFFEAWVETVFRRVTRTVGGKLRTGRQGETRVPLSWQPSFSGSQRSLVPDLILELENRTVIIDAKYKRHWEELGDRRWHQQTDELREQHRADLLQVLAYANLAAGNDVVCCLVYPCRPDTWESLQQRGRLFHRSNLPFHGRNVSVWLTAVPMSANIDRVVAPLIHQISQV